MYMNNLQLTQTSNADIKTYLIHFIN